MIKNIQALRGIAAILIYYHHFGFQNSVVMSFGDYGVTFFMVLSAFVLCLSYSKKRRGDICNTILFMKSRFYKIYPIYIVFWFVAIMILPYSGYAIGKILGIFLLQTWVPVPDIYFAGNPTSWFIADLMFCYVLFIPLNSLANNKTLMMCFTAYYILYFIVSFNIPNEFVTPIIYISPLMQLAPFMLGIFLFKIYQSVLKSKVSIMIRKNASLISIVIILMTVLQMFVYEYVSVRFTLSSYWWFIVSLTILIFSITDSKPNIISSLFHSRLMQTIGNVSFSLYLIHYIVINIWHRLEGHFIMSDFKFSLFWQSVVLLVILIPLSIVVNKFIEKPLVMFMRKRIVNS